MKRFVFLLQGPVTSAGRQMLKELVGWVGSIMNYTLGFANCTQAVKGGKGWKFTTNKLRSYFCDLDKSGFVLLLLAAIPDCDRERQYILCGGTIELIKMDSLPSNFWSCLRKNIRCRAFLNFF